jgi:hypothetical protein
MAMPDDVTQPFGGMPWPPMRSGMQEKILELEVELAESRKEVLRLRTALASLQERIDVVLRARPLQEILREARTNDGS